MRQKTKFHWLKVRSEEGEGMTPVYCEVLNAYTQGNAEISCELMAIDWIKNVLQIWNHGLRLTIEKISEDEFYVVVSGEANE